MWTQQQQIWNKSNNTIIQHTHTHVLRPVVQDYPGEPVPEGKTNLDLNEARDSEWQWHQLGRMQVCTLLQKDNHAGTPPLSFLQTGCPSCRPTNSVKALKAQYHNTNKTLKTKATSCHLVRHMAW